jgi:regulatory protein
MVENKLITKIEPQKRNPKRRSVFIDGKFAFGVDEEVVYHLGLKKGENLTEKRVAQIREGKSENEAKEAALRLLSFRRRTEKEIKDKLRQKGFDAKIIAHTVEKLKSYDLINDLEFATAWVKERLALKPRGKRLLRQELWKKGIQKDIIDKATEELCRDEEKAAVELLKKAGRRYKNSEPAIARRRMYSLLTRRGFSYETAKNALAHLASSSYDDED